MKPVSRSTLIRRVDIVAPGFSSTTQSVGQCRKFLDGIGLQARIPRKIFGRHAVSSNSIQNRLEHLQTALTETDSQMIWFLRGGYGCIHLLPGLAKMKKPKWKLCMGYSDITSFLIFAVQTWRWKLIHGPVLEEMAQKKVTDTQYKNVLKFLESGTFEVNFKLNLLNEKKKVVRGELLGGNLIVAGSTLGTPYQLVGRGRILFFEDVGERAYEIDRVLVQMEQAGVFAGCRAVVFGRFTQAEEPDGTKKVRAVCKDFALRHNFPVYSRLQVGHDRLQNIIPVGVPAVIDEQCRMHCSWV